MYPRASKQRENALLRFSFKMDFNLQDSVLQFLKKAKITALYWQYTAHHGFFSTVHIQRSNPLCDNPFCLPALLSNCLLIGPFPLALYYLSQVVYDLSDCNIMYLNIFLV